MTISLNGGRNKKAPYDVTHIRVPAPLKYQLEQLILSYKYVVLSENQGNINRFMAVLIEFVDSLPPQCDQLKLDFKLREKAETAISELAIKASTTKIVEIERKCDLLKEGSRNATALLKEALKLKANSGGAIKQEISKALALLETKDI